MEPTTENKTNEIKHDLLPDNTFTIILKAGGKVYSLGGKIGEKIDSDITDEDLDSTLRAVNGAGITLQRTIAVKLAGRDEAYKLPGDTVEQDLTPLVDQIAEVELDKSMAITGDGPLRFAYGVENGVITGIVGDLDAAEKAGVVVGQPAPEKQA